MAISVKTMNFWCQKVLPLVYDDSLSYYEVICKLVSRTNEIVEEMKNYAEFFEEFQTTSDEIKRDMENIKSELENIKNGAYIEVYIDALGEWIDNNLQELVAKIVKFVSFGLTDDGYFVAYIPQTWDFIKFDTIVDTNNELYGHLILEW